MSEPLPGTLVRTAMDPPQRVIIEVKPYTSPFVKAVFWVGLALILYLPVEMMLVRAYQDITTRFVATVCK